MSVIAIPNVSEGHSREILGPLAAAIAAAGGLVLDTHSDEFHGRSVFTVAGSTTDLIDSMVALAGEAAARVDLTTHKGIHPRLGALDVCPFVPQNGAMEEAVEAALATAERIGVEHQIPVYLYGRAARRPDTEELPDLRRGGLQALIARATALPPDFGPQQIDPRIGVVCVGARDVLIAFNVWIRCPVTTARAIATAIRTTGGGPPGVRALGLPLSPEMSQVSMNLIDPETTGVEAVYALVARAAESAGAEIEATEFVGLVPERFMPDPESEVARRCISPGHSLESVLGSI